MTNVNDFFYNGVDERQGRGRIERRERRTIV
jgi:hypothetical protein